MSDLNNMREREEKNSCACEKCNNAQNNQKNDNKYPKHLRILGIIGAVLIVVGIAVLIIGLVKKVPDMDADNWFDSQSAKMFTCFGGGVLMLLGFSLSFMALTPFIAKLNIKTTKYIAKDNKSDLKDIADTSGDIVSDMTKNLSRQTAEAFKEVNESNIDASSTENLSEKKALFCEKCGQPLSPTANYCKFCRAKINK